MPQLICKIFWYTPRSSSSKHICQIHFCQLCKTVAPPGELESFKQITMTSLRQKPDEKISKQINNNAKLLTVK